jgi:CRISPR-associated protein Cas1
LGGEREAPQKTGEPKQVKIVLRIEAVESRLAGVAQPAVETPAPAMPQPPPSPSRHENEPQQIPARMLNEFVYCQRLFYYEFVEGVFVESVDTLRGDAIHKRVDSGSGALPAAKKKAKKTTQDEPAATV